MFLFAFLLLQPLHTLADNFASDPQRVTVHFNAGGIVIPAMDGVLFVDDIEVGRVKGSVFKTLFFKFTMPPGKRNFRLERLARKEKHAKNNDIFAEFTIEAEPGSVALILCDQFSGGGFSEGDRKLLPESQCRDDNRISQDGITACANTDWKIKKTDGKYNNRFCKLTREKSWFEKGMFSKQVEPKIAHLNLDSEPDDAQAETPGNKPAVTPGVAAAVSVRSPETAVPTRSQKAPLAPRITRPLFDPDQRESERLSSFIFRHKNGGRDALNKSVNRKLYKKAIKRADSGYAHDAFIAALAYRSGHYRKLRYEKPHSGQDLEKAKFYLHKAAELGWSEAAFQLHYCYRDDGGGLSPDALALHPNWPANLLSCPFLDLRYYSDKTVFKEARFRPDPAKAWKYLKMAAERPDGWSAEIGKIKPLGDITAPGDFQAFVQAMIAGYLRGHVIDYAMNSMTRKYEGWVDWPETYTDMFRHYRDGVGAVELSNDERTIACKGQSAYRQVRRLADIEDHMACKEQDWLSRMVNALPEERQWNHENECPGKGRRRFRVFLQACWAISEEDEERDWWLESRLSEYIPYWEHKDYPRFAHLAWAHYKNHSDEPRAAKLAAYKKRIEREIALLANEWKWNKERGLANLRAARAQKQAQLEREAQAARDKQRAWEEEMRRFDNAPPPISAAFWNTSDRDFWKGINNIYNDTMRQINDARVRQQTSYGGNVSYTNSSTSEPSESRRTSDSRSSEPHPQDLERQNCENAGKTWTGSSCDYSSTVTVTGHGAGKRGTQSASKPGRWAGTTGDDVINGSNAADNGSAGGTASNSRSSTASGAGGRSNPAVSGSDKPEPPRLLAIFKQIESQFSWPTQEEACVHAKARAESLAETECVKSHKGRTAYKSEIGSPVDANCQSYRQIEKDGFSSKRGQWKVTGNVILQCRLP